LIFLGLLLYRFLLLFTYNGEIGGIDNNFIYGVIRAIRGLPLYPDPEQFPYSVNPYSPLYYTVCAALGKLFNLNPAEPHQIFILCRVVSLGCDLLSTFFVLNLVKKHSRPEIAAPIATLFFLILAYLGYTFSRVDSLYLLFYILFVSQLLSDHSRKRMIMLALLSALALFSKQTGIVIPVLALGWFWFRGEPKMIVPYLAVSTIFLASIGGIYYSFPGFEHLTDHTIKAINNRLDPSWFYVFIFKRLADSILLLLLYFPLLWSINRLLKKEKKVTRALAFLFITQTLFSLGTSLKWGSTLGYFNESFFLGLLILAWWVQEKSVDYFPRVRGYILPLIWLFSIHTFLQGYLLFLQDQGGKKLIYEEQKAIRDYLVPKLDNRYVLDLGHQNSNFFKTLMPGQLAVPNFDGLDCCTLPDKTFDYENLKDDLSTGLIQYLIVPAGENYPSIWGVSLQAFQKDTLIFGQQILRYQKP